MKQALSLSKQTSQRHTPVAPPSNLSKEVLSQQQISGYHVKFNIEYEFQFTMEAFLTEHLVSQQLIEETITFLNNTR